MPGILLLKGQLASARKSSSHFKIEGNKESGAKKIKPLSTSPTPSCASSAAGSPGHLLLQRLSHTPKYVPAGWIHLVIALLDGRRKNGWGWGGRQGKQFRSLQVEKEITSAQEKKTQCRQEIHPLYLFFVFLILPFLCLSLSGYSRHPYSRVSSACVTPMSL